MTTEDDLFRAYTNYAKVQEKTLQYQKALLPMLIVIVICNVIIIVTHLVRWYQ